MTDQRFKIVFSGELMPVWGGGSFGAGERVASDGWKPDVARV